MIEYLVLDQRKFTYSHMKLLFLGLRMIYKNFLPKERALVKNNNLYAWRESTQVQINKTGMEDDKNFKRI